MAEIIQIRRDTSANWATENPVLAQGEIGLELDSGQIKIGDGSTTWTGLTYFDPIGGSAPALVTESGTARTLTAADNGKTIRCTNASDVAITCDDSCPVGFHCLIVQEGAGAVTIDSENADTCNGEAAGTGVGIADQWKSAYVYQPTEGAWVVVS